MSEERAREATKKAMKLLERMDRSEAGLTQRLLQAGYTEEEARLALDYVRSYGYVDDARFAENYIRANLALKARTKILAALAEKGIDKETALEAWEEVCQYEDHDEDTLIRSALRKRCPQGVPDDPAEKRRLIGYLSRRGFGYADIRRVLEEEGAEGDWE